MGDNKFPVPQNDKERYELAEYIGEKRRNRKPPFPSGTAVSLSEKQSSCLNALPFVDDITYYFEFFNKKK